MAHNCDNIKFTSILDDNFVNHQLGHFKEYLKHDGGFPPTLLLKTSKNKKIHFLPMPDYVKTATDRLKFFAILGIGFRDQTILSDNYGNLEEVLLISDVFYTSQPKGTDISQVLPPSQDINRKEAVLATGMNNQGKKIFTRIDYERIGNKIKFDKLKKEKDTSQLIGSLDILFNPASIQLIQNLTDQDSFDKEDSLDKERTLIN